MFLISTFYHWNSENTINENPSEVTTSAQVGSIEASSIIQTPGERPNVLPTMIDSVFPSHGSKLYTVRTTMLANSRLGLFPMHSLVENLPLLAEAQFYAFFQYEYVNVRITISAPKSVTGAISLGYFPFTRSLVSPGLGDQTRINALLSSGPFCNMILNRYDTKLLSLGEPVDVVFKIPWMYPFIMMPITYLQSFDSIVDSAVRDVETGEPVLTACVHALQSQTTVAGSANVKMIHAIHYEGLKLSGRVSGGTDAMNFQSATVTSFVAGVAKKKVADIATQLIEERLDAGSGYVSDLIDSAANSVCTVTGLCTGSETKSTFTSNDEQPEHSGAKLQTPKSFTPNIVGDTMNCCPATSQSLRAPMNLIGRVPHKHSSSNMTVAGFIRRPQLIYKFDYNTTASGTGLFTAPCDFSNQGTYPTWLAYFGQIARFWRGSLRYHFVFFGHPGIETRFSVAYSPYLRKAITAANLEGTPLYETHTMNFSGSKTVSILVPYVHTMEYLPLDKTLSMPREVSCTGKLVFQTSVLSSMFEGTPTLTCMVFISAGPDFAFYDPTPPGFMNVVNPPLSKTSTEDIKKYRKEMYDYQCVLPGEPDPIILMSAYSTPDPGLYKPLVSLRQIASFWSRNIEQVEYSLRYVKGPNFGGSIQAGSTWTANTEYSLWDYVSYAHSMFLYWNGGLGFKTVFEPLYTFGNHQGYAYVTITDPYEQVNTYSTIVPYPGSPLGSTANWGSGTIITRVSEQPVMEFTIPMRHSIAASFVHYADSTDPNTYSRYGYCPPAFIDTNLLATAYDPVEDQTTTVDLIYRKVCSDFSVFVESLMPFPSFWATRGFAQS